MCKQIDPGMYNKMAPEIVAERNLRETDRLWHLVLEARRARMKAYEVELAALDDFAMHVRGINRA